MRFNQEMAKPKKEPKVKKADKPKPLPKQGTYTDMDLLGIRKLPTKGGFR